MILADEAVDEGDHGLAGARQDELFPLRIEIELEAGGERGDPDLAHGRIGRDDESGARVFEKDIQDTALFFDLEAGLLVFLARDEMALEAVEGRFGGAAKLLLALHGPSVASSLGSSPAA